MFIKERKKNEKRERKSDSIFCSWINEFNEKLKLNSS